MLSYIKHTDKKGTDIIEGEKKSNNEFSISKFICKVQEQETKKETQEVADMLVKALTDYNKKIK